MVVRKRAFISVRLSSILYFKAEIIKVSIKLNYNQAETLKHLHDDRQQWRNKPSFIHHFSSDGSQNKNQWSLVTSDVLALFKWSSSLQLDWQFCGHIWMDDEMRPLATVCGCAYEMVMTFIQVLDCLIACVGVLSNSLWLYLLWFHIYGILFVKLFTPNSTLMHFTHSQKKLRAEKTWGGHSKVIRLY